MSYPPFIQNLFRAFVLRVAKTASDHANRENMLRAIEEDLNAGVPVMVNEVMSNIHYHTAQCCPEYLEHVRKALDMYAEHNGENFLPDLDAEDPEEGTTIQ